MEFHNMDVDTIMNGVDSDGVRYLELFLKEYTRTFDEKVNPGCSKCITNYLSRYKKHYNMQNSDKNTCEYRLHAKYENIPLEFGSPVLVNNSNITDEYAKKLLKHKDGERYFAVIPENTDALGGDTGITLEQLQENVSIARNELEALPEKAHPQTKKAKERKLAEAEKALDDFKAQLTADAENIIVVLTADDIASSPELGISGFVEGDKVIVDGAKHKEGILEIIGKANDE